MGNGSSGQLIFQLKSFPLKMLRLGRYAINQAKKNPDGDRNLAPLLLYMTAGPAMGFTAANVKDVVQMRGGEDNREGEFRERKLSKTITPFEGMLNENADKALGWYWDGFMTMGGLGILGELMYDTVQQADNGAYGQVKELLPHSSAHRQDYSLIVLPFLVAACLRLVMQLAAVKEPTAKNVQRFAQSSVVSLLLVKWVASEKWVLTS